MLADNSGKTGDSLANWLGMVAWKRNFPSAGASPCAHNHNNMAVWGRDIPTFGTHLEFAPQIPGRCGRIATCCQTAAMALHPCVAWARSSL